MTCERTVYTLTSEGRRELHVLRDAMLRSVVLATDPFDLAIACSPDIPAQTLLGIIEDRKAELQVHASALAHLRSSAAEHLDDRDQLLFEHALARLQAELTWHDHLRTALASRHRGKEQP